MYSSQNQTPWLNQEHDTMWSPGPVKGVHLFRAKFSGDAQPPHTHDWFFIGMIEKGARAISTTRRDFTASPGRMITLNPLEAHSCRAMGRWPSHYRAVYLDPAFVRRAIGVDRESECLVAFKQPLLEDAGLTAHLSDLIRGLEREPHGPAATEQFMHTMHVIFDSYGGNPPEPTPEGRAVARSLAYIRGQAHRDLSVDELAGRAGLSKFHFIRVFKAATGLSPHAYLVQRRLEICKRAIDEGAPLADAAAEAGFADQAHMSRWFKQVYSVTPGAYQRRLAGTGRASRP